ncbi:MAG: VOC family protein [Acidimicrobiales bacterium]|nr:VOC family protein [Acidimicrobiales bacterium]
METPTVVPSLAYADPKAATEWLADAFGFELTMAIEDPDNPAMAHYEMSCGGTGRVMLGGHWVEWFRSPSAAGGINTQTVHVSVDAGIDSHFDHSRAHGAEIIQEPADQFFGHRTYRALDCEGHCWTFSQKVREVTRAKAEAAIGVPIFATEWA